MEPFLISIIVPVRDEPRLIDWLQKIGTQTQNHEVIVVDTSSIPTMMSVPTVRYLHRPNFKWRSQALNEGARNAKGDLLLFLHSDCELPKDALYPLQNSSLEAGAFLKEYVPTNIVLRLYQGLNNVLKIISGTNGIFVRRDIFFQHGSFQEVPLCEDLMLWKKFKKSCEIRLVPLKILVSSRKYQSFFGMKRIIQNGFIYILFLLGIRSKILEKLY